MLRVETKNSHHCSFIHSKTYFTLHLHTFQCTNISVLIKLFGKYYIFFLNISENFTSVKMLRICLLLCFLTVLGCILSVNEISLNFVCSENYLTIINLNFGVLLQLPLLETWFYRFD